MIRYTSERQLSLDGFILPFGGKLNPTNRWIKLSGTIPWDDLVKGYHKKLNADQGRPAKNGRLVIGSVIIKHKLNLSDDETVLQIQENPYLQDLVGFSRYQEKPPFVPSLFVEIRRRMGSEVFDAFEQAILARLDESRKRKLPSQKPPVDPGAESGSSDQKVGNNKACQSALKKTSKTESEMATESDHKGKLIIDATVANQAIRHPTDLGILNESREISEKLIDDLAKQSGSKKSRTYRLNYIRARTVKTAEAWIRAIFLVMNLLVLSRNLCARRMEAVKSSFLRYLSEQLSSLRLDLELFGLETWQSTKLRMSF